MKRKYSNYFYETNLWTWLEEWQQINAMKENCDVIPKRPYTFPTLPHQKRN